MPETPPFNSFESRPIGFIPEVLPPNTPAQFTTGFLYPSTSSIVSEMPMPIDPSLRFIEQEGQSFGTELEDPNNNCSFDPPVEVPFDSFITVDGIDSELCASWQHCSSSGPFPPNLVRAGVDADGCKIFVGRAFHEGDMIPAKVVPEKNIATISYGGEEIEKEDFEVLRQGDFVWEFAANGSVPDGAVVIGKTIDGENLYMGRALYQGSQTPGKVQGSHGCCYIPFDGEEVALNEYEVLCIK